MCVILQEEDTRVLYCRISRQSTQMSVHEEDTCVSYCRRRIHVCAQRHTSSHVSFATGLLSAQTLNPKHVSSASDLLSAGEHGGWNRMNGGTFRSFFLTVAQNKELLQP